MAVTSIALEAQREVCSVALEARHVNLGMSQLYSSRRLKGRLKILLAPEVLGVVDNFHVLE